MKPYYQDEYATIYHGDALDLMMDGTIGEIDGVVMDPPYCSGGRNVGTARKIFEKSMREDWFLTDNMGTDTYIWWIRHIGANLFRLATVGSHFYCFTDWRQYNNVVLALESVGWTLRSCIVWNKMKGGAMGSFWRNDHEWIAVFSKGPNRPLPNGGFFNVLSDTKPQGDLHPTVKPLSVIQRLVEATDNGLLLDPFMGSGTTLLAAKNLGRMAIGIEVEEKYCEEAALRLSQEVLPLT